jgi:hypothetical protein
MYMRKAILGAHYMRPGPPDIKALCGSKPRQPTIINSCALVRLAAQPVHYAVTV